MSNDPAQRTDNTVHGVHLQVVKVPSVHMVTASVHPTDHLVQIPTARERNLQSGPIRSCSAWRTETGYSDDTGIVVC